MAEMIMDTHFGGISAQTAPRLQNDPDVAGLAATVMTEGHLDGPQRHRRGPAVRHGERNSLVLAGRLPSTPDEIAPGGRDLRALRKRVGELITARGARGSVAIHSWRRNGPLSSSAAGSPSSS
jgi:hypothetical protein